MKRINQKSYKNSYKFICVASVLDHSTEWGKQIYKNVFCVIKPDTSFQEIKKIILDKYTTNESRNKFYACIINIITFDDEEDFNIALNGITKKDIYDCRKPTKEKPDD